MTAGFNPNDPPCEECGREVDECICRGMAPDDFDPLRELDGYDPDFDDYEPGDLTNENEESPSALG